MDTNDGRRRPRHVINDRLLDPRIYEMTAEELHAFLDSGGRAMPERLRRSDEGAASGKAWTAQISSESG